MTLSISKLIKLSGFRMETFEFKVSQDSPTITIFKDAIKLVLLMGVYVWCLSTFNLYLLVLNVNKVLSDQSQI